MTVAVELILIVMLVMGNGLFAGAEIAMLSVRKTRVRELADEGNRSARALMAIRAQPERFLATVQIGITVIGATAAAFGGHDLARRVAEVFRRGGFSERTAENVALAAVIGSISFLSLVLGELVPKSLALKNAERYALLAARPLLALSSLARPLVWLLTASSNLVLRIFRDRTTFTEARLSKEELQQLVDEAATVGAVDRQAGAIAYRALDFGDIRVGAIMVPRAEMVTTVDSTTHEEARMLLARGAHSRIPVVEAEQTDDVIGYVTSRDLLAVVAEGASRTVRDVIRPALFVPETRRAADVLRDMQEKRDHLALVIDAHGAVTGLVTMEDILEELVGEIFAEHEVPAERIRREPDGGAVVRGWVPVHEVNRELGIELPEGAGWVTIAGLTIAIAGAIPRAGTRLPAGRGLTLEVLEASSRRVLAVRVLPRPPDDDAGTPEKDDHDE